MPRRTTPDSDAALTELQQTIATRQRDRFRRWLALETCPGLDGEGHCGRVFVSPTEPTGSPRILLVGSEVNGERVDWPLCEACAAPLLPKLAAMREAHLRSRAQATVQRA